MTSFFHKFKPGNISKWQTQFEELKEQAIIFEEREQEFEQTEQNLQNKQVQIETFQQERNQLEEQAYQFQIEHTRLEQEVKEAEEKLRILKDQEAAAAQVVSMEKNKLNEKDHEIVRLQKELEEETALWNTQIEEHTKEVIKYEKKYEILREKGFFKEEIVVGKRENLSSNSSFEQVAVAKEEHVEDISPAPSETIVLSHMIAFSNLSVLKANLRYVFENVSPLPPTIIDNGLGEIVLKIEFTCNNKNVQFFLSLHKENNSLSISYFNDAMTLVEVGIETKDGILIKQKFDEKTIHEMLLSALRTTTMFKMK